MLLPYGSGMDCAVLTCIVVLLAYGCDVRYAMCGTDIPNGATGLRVWYGLCGTERAAGGGTATARPRGAGRLVSLLCSYAMLLCFDTTLCSYAKILHECFYAMLLRYTITPLRVSMSMLLRVSMRLRSADAPTRIRIEIT
eukprot:2351587-Rhodomonas_salina.2